MRRPSGVNLNPERTQRVKSISANGVKLRRRRESHARGFSTQYQMLKGFGYDDDHIILILEDDLGSDVHVTVGGENLRTGAVIDYKTSRVTAEDLRNIFSGTVTERTPAVVKGGPGTNVYLSNRFTRVFRSTVEANPTISLHDLYYQLATHTTASHAGLYNDACYGNVYRNTLKEFLKP